MAKHVGVQRNKFWFIYRSDQLDRFPLNQPAAHMMEGATFFLSEPLDRGTYEESDPRALLKGHTEFNTRGVRAFPRASR